MLKKPKILVVGSYVMDLIASAPRVPNMGETIIGSDFRMGAMPSLPTITEVQTLLRERNYSGLDPGLLDALK